MENPKGRFLGKGEAFQIQNVEIKGNWRFLIEKVSKLYPVQISEDVSELYQA